MAAIMDLHTRKIVGWPMRDHPGRSGASPKPAEQATVAPMMATRHQRPGPGRVHHSGGGIQHARGDYQAALDRAGTTASMSRRANALDDAPVESFFHRPKTGPVHHRT